jgi:hypothetical protein
MYPRTMRDAGTTHGPIDERLLDVRTPAQLALTPDGRTLAFALTATVADTGSFVPSDLYLIPAGADEPVLLTGGAWSDRSRHGHPTVRDWRSARIGSPPVTNSRTR